MDAVRANALSVCSNTSQGQLVSLFLTLLWVILKWNTAMRKIQITPPSLIREEAHCEADLDGKQHVGIHVEWDSDNGKLHAQ